MLPRTLRVLLFAIVTIALWAVASPAMAMPAPFCDDRGATAMAPEPTLEAPDVAVQRAHVAPSCSGEDTNLGATVAPGRVHAPIVASGTDSALPACAVGVPPASVSCAAFVPYAPLRADGVTSTLDRPPRR